MSEKGMYTLKQADVVCRRQKHRKCGGGAGRVAGTEKKQHDCVCVHVCQLESPLTAKAFETPQPTRKLYVRSLTRGRLQKSCVFIS